MSLSIQLNALVSRLGEEFQEVNMLATGSIDGSLASLSTTDKTNLIAAINEVHNGLVSLDGAKLVIDDSAVSTEKTYSSSKIASELTKLKAELLGDGEIDGVLDTIREIAAYAEANKDLIDSLTTLASKRVSVVEGEVLSETEQTFAKQNMGLDQDLADIETAQQAQNKQISEVDGRVAAEKTEREDAVSAINTAISAEETARKAADDVHTSEISRIEQEYKAADEAHSSAIDAEKADRIEAVSGLAAAINSEISERVKQDGLLSTKIDEREIAVKSLITAEEKARTDADKLHTDAINKEVTDRQAAITSVEGKVTKAAADQKVADDAERVVRVAAEKAIDDKVVALNTALGDTELNLVHVFESALAKTSSK